MRVSSSRRMTMLVASALAASAATAFGIGPTQELPSGGLLFVAQEKIQIISEQLIIGLDRIELTYVLTALERERVSLAIAFPLPTIDLAQLQGIDVAVPSFDPTNPTNFVGFWTLVDGQPVEPEVDVRAFAVGQIDVTRRLLELGLPLYPLALDMAERLAALPTDARNDLADGSIVTVVDNVTRPLWALRTVFHWRTVIGGNAPVTIQHHYKPIVGNTQWSADISEPIKRKYCLSDADASTLDRRAATGKAPTIYWVHYQPASNGWVKGSSETFRLTIDKGSTSGIAATCTKGLRSATATTLELVAADRADDVEIDVLFVE
jgi:Domain of unknown function (DUF4424)